MNQTAFLQLISQTFYYELCVVSKHKLLRKQSYLAKLPIIFDVTGSMF